MQSSIKKKLLFQAQTNKQTKMHRKHRTGSDSSQRTQGFAGRSESFCSFKRWAKQCCGLLTSKSIAKNSCWPLEKVCVYFQRLKAAQSFHDNYSMCLFVCWQLISPRGQTKSNVTKPFKALTEIPSYNAWDGPVHKHIYTVYTKHALVIVTRAKVAWHILLLFSKQKKRPGGRNGHISLFC